MPMPRRLVPLAVLVAVVIGCAKKKDDDSGVGGDGGDPTPTGPAYTIKLRDEQRGDKFAVVGTSKQTITVNAAGPKGKIAKSQQEVEKYDYTETIAEMPPGSERATKATRTYT